MNHSLECTLRSKFAHMLIACISVCLVAASWLPALPLTSSTLPGYGGVAGLLAAFALERQVIELLKRYATIDPLTGLSSRAFLESLLTRELDAAARHGEQAAIIFIDVDHFKQVNDCYGHSFGDEMLRAVAHSIQESTRACDTAARFGGDEFVVFLTRADRAAASHVAERIRAGVESITLPLPSQRKPRALKVTISLGIAMFPEDGADPKSLLRRADASLYEAKRGGRNSVVLSDENRPMPSGNGQMAVVRI